MPIPIVNSIASWFLKKRSHQIELFVKYPIEVQEELLQNLLSKARQTEVGRRYDFASIRSYADFARQVPVSTYEEIEYDPPLVILDELAQLEAEIQQGMAELREMLL